MSYLLVRKNRGIWNRLSVPVTFGAGIHSDVIINAGTLADVAYVATSLADKLNITRITDHKLLAADYFDRFGIQLAGPVAGTPGRSFRQVMRETAAQEQLFLRHLPKFIQRFLLADFPPRLRYTAWGIMILCGIYGLVKSGRGQEHHADLSDNPISLEYDTVRTELTGSSSRRPGYEKGALFNVQVPNTGSLTEHLLSFEAAGLNIGGEVGVIVNDVQYFTSDASASCITEFCNFDVKIPDQAFKQDLNTIRFSHQPETSAWFVKNIHLRGIQVATAVEREDIERRIAVAERTYSERGISPENLLLARSELEIGIKLATIRSGMEQLQARMIAMKSDVERAFSEIVAALQSDVSIDMKLGRSVEAQRKLQILLHLFPDPTQPEYQRATEDLKVLKDLKK